MPTIEESDARKNKLLPIMKALPQWYCWASHRNGWKDDKIPLDTDSYDTSRGEFTPRDYQAEEIWMEYDEAKRLSLEEDAIDGIGFVMENYNLCYIDIDDCVSPDSMGVSEEVRSIIDRIGSYTEVSVSGTGLHILCTGELDSYGWSRGGKSVEISAFDGSCLAITENHVKHTPYEVKNCPEDLKSLCERYDFDTHGGW